MRRLRVDIYKRVDPFIRLLCPSPKRERFKLPILVCPPRASICLVEKSLHQASPREVALVIAFARVYEYTMG